MSFVLRMKLQSEIEDKIFKCWRKLWGLPQLQAAQNLWLWPSQSSAGLWVSISGHILVCWVLDSQLSTEAAHLSPHQPNIILQNIVRQKYKQSLFVLEQNKREYCQMIQSKYGQLQGWTTLYNCLFMLGESVVDESRPERDGQTSAGYPI